MLPINNSLVLRFSTVDNINDTSWTGELAGEDLLETSTKTIQTSELAELIARAQSGNLEAFERLYNLYKKKVYGLAFNLTRDHQQAEDLVQDIFIKIFSSIQNIDRPELFPAWVYRISLNTCYSYLRREKALDRKMEELLPAEEGLSNDLFDSRENDLTRCLELALSELPEKLRNVFLLHEVEGLTHEEIARMLGCQVGTSKSQLFKARIKLQKILRKKNLLKGAKL